MDEELELIYRKTHSAFLMDPFQKNEMYHKIKQALQSENPAQEIVMLFEKELQDREASIADKITQQSYGIVDPSVKKSMFRRI
jgi:flagellin-specific chaperone FliS